MAFVPVPRHAKVPFATRSTDAELLPAGGNVCMHVLALADHDFCR
jgi:hypothetical protein